MPRKDDSAPTGIESAEAAIRRELATLPSDLGQSGIAAAALVLARGLDEPGSLTSKAMAAKALDDLMSRLHALAPPKEKHDAIDEIGARRAERQARVANSAPQVRS